MTDQTIQNENQNQTNHLEPNNDHLKGLGGWLIVVGLGLLIAPISLCIFLYSTYSEIFTDGIWEMLTMPESEVFVPYFGVMLITEICVNILLLFAIIYTGYLYFSKNKSFPKWYVGIMVFSIVFIILDAFAVSSILPDTKVFDKDTLRELGRSLLGAMIWIPYMRVSKRVKATFVN